ncbi:hypothetical protein AABM17_802 [Neisseria musculi]|uniref:Uncharacterized protein n=1 Tax=Neisseria musculi TaxID=1815583 RepID=A0A7H1MEF6_9NEIS|nr:hypothetical protein H7A79_0802 [Neisseria musculi]
MGLPFAVFMLCIYALIAWSGNKILNEDDEKTVR